MKIYKFKFTRLIIILMILAMLLAVLGFSLNIVKLIDLIEKGGSTYSYISAVVMLIMTTALAVILTSVMISSHYKLTEKQLMVRFGVVKTLIPLKDIYRITHFKKTNKLVIYFGEDKYSVIVVKDVWYDDFIKTILQYNPKIAYDLSNDEADDEKQA